jgi:putative flippase GtrA
VKGQLLRFALVGGVNTAVYYGLYLLCVPYLPYPVAHVGAFALATTGSFFLNARLVYRTSATWRKFLRFPLSTAVNLVVSTAGLRLLVEWAHLDRRVAPLLAAAVAVPVTFLVARRVMLPAARSDAGRVRSGR